MKYIVTICLLIPLFSNAQDPVAIGCKLNKQTDPYTKETKLSTGFIQLNGGSVTIDADSKEIDVFFTISGNDKCFDYNSMAAVYFEGTKMKLSVRNSGSMNCEGLYHFIFKNTPTTNSILQKIATQKINNIVFTGNNKKETKLTFIPDQQQKVMELTTCLVNEAKTLIK
ncbi:MAG: hypothetical protein ABUL41_00035 [Chitinophagaceae bacterium]